MLCFALVPVSAAITLPAFAGGLHPQTSDWCEATSTGTLMADRLASKTVLPQTPATTVVWVDVSTMPSGRRALILLGNGDFRFTCGKRAAMLAAEIVPELVPTSQTFPPPRM